MLDFDSVFKGSLGTVLDYLIIMDVWYLPFQTNCII